LESSQRCFGKRGQTDFLGTAFVEQSYRKETQEVSMMKGVKILLGIVAVVAIAGLLFAQPPYWNDTRPYGWEGAQPQWGGRRTPNWRGGCHCCYRGWGYRYAPPVDTARYNELLSTLKKGTPFKNRWGELRIPLIDKDGYIKGILFEDVDLKDVKIGNFRPYSADLIYRDRIVGTIHF